MNASATTAMYTGAPPAAGACGRKRTTVSNVAFDPGGALPPAGAIWFVRTGAAGVGFCFRGALPPQLASRLLPREFASLKWCIGANSDAGVRPVLRVCSRLRAKRARGPGGAAASRCGTPGGVEHPEGWTEGPTREAAAAGGALNLKNLLYPATRRRCRPGTCRASGRRAPSSTSQRGSLASAPIEKPKQEIRRPPWTKSSALRCPPRTSLASVKRPSTSILGAGLPCPHGSRRSRSRTTSNGASSVQRRMAPPSVSPTGPVPANRSRPRTPREARPIRDSGISSPAAA